jgi:hypothetical protein
MLLCFCSALLLLCVAFALLCLCFAVLLLYVPSRCFALPLLCVPLRCFRVAFALCGLALLLLYVAFASRCFCVALRCFELLLHCVDFALCCLFRVAPRCFVWLRASLCFCSALLLLHVAFALLCVASSCFCTVLIFLCAAFALCCLFRVAPRCFVLRRMACVAFALFFCIASLRVASRSISLLRVAFALLSCCFAVLLPVVLRCSCFALLLFRAALRFRVVSRCFASLCVSLRLFALFCIFLRYFAWSSSICVALRRFASLCAVSHFFVLLYVALRCLILLRLVLLYFASYCIVLHCYTSLCITLFCTALFLVFSVILWRSPFFCAALRCFTQISSHSITTLQASATASSQGDTAKAGKLLVTSAELWGLNGEVYYTHCNSINLLILSLQIYEPYYANHCSTSCRKYSHFTGRALASQSHTKRLTSRRKAIALIAK